MGNQEHMHRMNNSTVEEWNHWRGAHLEIQPDLTRIDLSNRDLQGVDFRGVGLFKANLSNTNLQSALLRQAILIGANFTGANLTGAHVYGISAWDVNMENAIQKDMIITGPHNPTVVTLDDLRIAQFVHLMLVNENIRDAIQTISSKAVLILGRFTEEHKAVLDSIREKLRDYNYVPILFDFKRPENRGITETVATLAHLSKHIIVDLSDAVAVPQELTTITPQLSSVTVLPIVRSDKKVYGMFEHFSPYPWVGNIVSYDDVEDITNDFKAKIIDQLQKLSEYKRPHRSRIIRLNKRHDRR